MKFVELDFNEEFIATFDALENTAGHLFITGKAGTGKSTLLKYFCQKTEKKVALLAPTGVAAINIKGQTIHSFFGFKPDITPETVGDIPVRKRKRKMYQQLQAVIIDEISMVRADLLDCVDIFLRMYGPYYDRPFGGVQMIFFGDLFQLPPVVAAGEEAIFKTHYLSPYFFSAKVFGSLDVRMLQLTKIYRQKDEDFISLLNAVRDDNLQEHHWQTLNRRFRQTPQEMPGEFYIVLTTTNALAEKVNNEHLQNLKGQSRFYQGIVSGEFDRKSLPTCEMLELKEGAQIMMLNNDPEKRWVNGSLGKIVGIITSDEGEDTIQVELENNGIVDVKKHTWDIFQYYFDQEANALASRTVGYFTQYPLKLAWAVTIHKSQGQTFEKVIIDIGWGTFAHGQMYVALSRCTSLEGVVLKKPLTPRHVLMDKRILEFMKKRLQVLGAVLLFSFASLTWGQQMPPEDPSASWLSAHSNEPYIGLLSETDTMIDKDWSFVENYHARIKVQKDTVKNLGQWPVYYNQSREKILDIKASLETPDGRRFEVKEIKDSPGFNQSPLYDDMRVKLIDLPEVKAGAIIDVRVKTMVWRQEIPNQFVDEVAYPSMPTAYARFSFAFDQNLPIKFQVYNNAVVPMTQKKDGKVKYTFVFKNTSYSQNEDFMPSSDEVVGIVSLSSLNDWKQVGDWWREQINMNIKDDPTITRKTFELITQKSSDKDKARAILEYIQDTFRYVPMSMGEHEVALNPTSVIFSNYYGNVKDLGLLAMQMFKIAGLEANLCLFSGEFNGDPKHVLPSLLAFDRVLLQVKLDNQLYYIDTQAKGFDIGQLPSSYDHAHVLVFGFPGYHFDNVPVADESFHAIVSSSDITIGEDGSADYQVHVKMPVEASEDFKNSWNGNDESKAKFFENLQATFASGGKLIDRNVKGLEDRYGPLEFDFKYHTADAYQVVNDMVLIKEAQQTNVPDFNEEERHYPIFIPTNSLIESHNTYHWPPGFRLDFVPQDYNLQNDFMRVSCQYTQTADSVTVNSVYHLKRAWLPQQTFGELKKFDEELYTKNQQYIVLKKISHIPEQAKDWVRSQ